jgi:hypothetical protein
MELNLVGLSELQVADLRVVEESMLRAISNRDVEAWSTCLRRMMAWYPLAVPNPIAVPAEFYAVLDTHMKARADLMGADARVNPDAPFMSFRGVPVVAAAAT